MDKIIIGSTYFFSCYEDFCSKDVDELQIIDTTEFAQIRQTTGSGKCLFQLKKHKSKNDYIDWALSARSGMVIGKFLVPEFCKAIDFNIEDLHKLYPLISRLDRKHKYEEIIFNSYLENNAFTLTQEQRNLAYQSYKETRRI